MLTSCESILEDLLKAQELQDAEVHGRMEAQATLVRAESRVVLHAETAVDLDLALVILPCDSELDDPLRDSCDLEGLFVLWLFLKQGAVLEG